MHIINSHDSIISVPGGPEVVINGVTSTATVVVATVRALTSLLVTTLGPASRYVEIVLEWL